MVSEREGLTSVKYLYTLARTDMFELLLANEPLIRISFFLGILGMMATWEAAAPRRQQEVPRSVRWPNNLGVVVVNTILVRLSFPSLWRSALRSSPKSVAGGC